MRIYSAYRGTKDDKFIIKQTIDNIGGTLVIRDVNWDEDKNINGIKFLRGDSGTDAHFKNTNGGKIGLHSWNFTESGRIIIDADDKGNIETKNRILKM